MLRRPPDILVTRSGGAALLLRNEANVGHSLALRLAGRQSNRDAIGARVYVSSGERRQFQEVRSARSYLSQGETTLRFGLGAANEGHVEVLWPSGSRQVVGRLVHGEYLLVEGHPARRVGRGILSEP